MRRFIFISALFLLAGNSYSQKLYFPSSLFSDSVSLEKNIPVLASQAIRYYNNPDSFGYFQKLTELRILAKQYPDALTTLEKLISFLGRDTNDISSVNFIYRPFIIAGGQYEAEPGKKFSDLYEKAAESLYGSLTETAATELSGVMHADLSLKYLYIKPQIERIGKSYQGDSISYQSALELCEQFTSLTLYAELAKAAPKLFASLNQKYHVDDSVLIKMPDGGQLAATIVRKSNASEKKPVILVYNIYPGTDKMDAMGAANHDYVGVVVNTRGKRLSRDSIMPFERDADDAWHIIDWISKQPWCNGEIGMYGGSYLGFSQWSATKKLHPALKTVIPMVAVGPGIDFPDHNGIFMSYMLRWIHYVTNNKMTDIKDFSDSVKWNSLFARWYKSGASFRSLDSLDGSPNAIFQNWLNHPAYDQFWQNMTPQKDEFSKINIPVLTITGYYDDDQLGAFHYYREHHKWNPNAGDNHYLLIGPYDHSGSQGYPRKTLVDYMIDSSAQIPIMDIVFQWFDHVLKGSAMPALLKDKVNFQVMGKNEWRNVPSLEKANNDTLTFYLAKGDAPGNYKLGTKKSSRKEFISQTVNMKERDFMKFEDDALAGVNRIMDTVIRKSPDEMIFVSDPLPQTMEINGSAVADIFASVNKKDVDLVMHLYVQEPDGKYFYLNRNLQRASMAKDKTKRQLLVPGKIENIQMSNTFFTSKLVKKGSRIVITLGINKSPGWQINYGSGKDVSDETIEDAGAPMQIRWYNNSTIKIPVWR